MVRRAVALAAVAAALILGARWWQDRTTEEERAAEPPAPTRLRRKRPPVFMPPDAAAAPAAEPAAAPPEPPANTPREVVDPDGDHHRLYIHADGRLVYTAPKGWEATVAERTEQVGALDLAVESDGVSVHTAWFDRASGMIRYTRFEADDVVTNVFRKDLARAPGTTRVRVTLEESGVRITYRTPAGEQTAQP